MGKLFEKFKDSFDGDVTGGGGCSTCGYGAQHLMSNEAFERLLKEMDEWAEKEFFQRDHDESTL